MFITSERRHISHVRFFVLCLCEEQSVSESAMWTRHAHRTWMRQESVHVFSRSPQKQKKRKKRKQKKGRARAGRGVSLSGTAIRAPENVDHLSLSSSRVLRWWTFPAFGGLSEIRHRRASPPAFDALSDMPPPPPGNNRCKYCPVIFVDLVSTAP